ncbi:MAG: class I SAM-dependent methyltransferase [Patescibacteria group bacterium]
MLILEIISIFLLSCLALFCLWYFLDALSCKEDIITNKDTTKKIIKFININFPQENIFYDLGSSMGSFALDLAEKCPQLQITGIDNSLLRILISKLRAFLQNKKIIFLKKDIFETDLLKANLIYVFIPLILLPKLAIKLERELSRKAVVITSVSNPVNFTGWELVEVIPKNPKNKNERDIFIYKFPFRKIVG